jgi:hypothetical protein
LAFVALAVAAGFAGCDAGGGGSQFTDDDEPVAGAGGTPVEFPCGIDCA